MTRATLRRLDRERRAEAQSGRLAVRMRALRAIRHKAGDRLDDSSYRAILRRKAGVDSSTQIATLAQAEAVIAEFQRLGLAAEPARKPLTRMQRKMWSLWQQLADRGLVKNRKMPSLLAWIKRQAGVDALGWLSGAQENEVVEALKAWLERPEPAKEK